MELKVGDYVEHIHRQTKGTITEVHDTGVQPTVVVRSDSGWTAKWFIENVRPANPELALIQRLARDAL